MTTPVSVSIDSLPNEILILILSEFRTKDLISYAGVSRHFYSIVTRAIHHRVLTAAKLPNNELILECYHPSAKISTPYLSCQKLGVCTLDGHPMVDECARLPEVHRIYSSFRPVVIESNRRSWRFRTSIMNFGLVDGSQHPWDAMPDPREDVFLDSGELFSQLCTVTNVVKEGPRNGLFVSHVNVSDGVIRVWREWLAQRVARSSEAQDVEEDDDDGDRILWADKDRHVGLRFHVTLGPSERMPLLSSLEDHEPVSYTLEYKGQTILLWATMAAYGEQGINRRDRATSPVITASFGDREVTAAGCFRESDNHILHLRHSCSTTNSTGWWLRYDETVEPERHTEREESRSCPQSGLLFLFPAFMSRRHLIERLATR